MGHDKPTFYLYGQGEPEDIIRIGNLVLKDPRNPRVPGYYWTADPLNDSDRNALTYSTPIEGEFASKSGAKLGLAVEAAELVTLDLSWTRDRDRLVTAKAGQRVLLKDPQAFLNEKILSHPKALEQLRLWLTTGNYLKHLLSPKVWSSETTINPGISSVTLAAICSVPVGGSILIGTNKKLENKLTAHGNLVWAAQYRLLDLKYISKPTPGSMANLPQVIRLLPDVVGNATLRGEDADFVQVSLSSSASDGPDMDDVIMETSSNLENENESAWSEFDQTLQGLIEYFQD